MTIAQLQSFIKQYTAKRNSLQAQLGLPNTPIKRNQIQMQINAIDKLLAGYQTQLAALLKKGSKSTVLSTHGLSK